jgi:ATP-binding cassette subfamily B protein/subfamily B ATP-binding cassette protein MsbA
MAVAPAGGGLGKGGGAAGPVDASFGKEFPDVKLVGRILGYYRPFAGRILGAFLLLGVATGLNLLKPWPLKFVVDSVLASPQGFIAVPFLPGTWSFAAALALTCGSLIGIHLLWGAVNLAQTYALIEIGLKALLRVRTELYAYLQSLPLRFHDARRSTDSSFRVAYDAQAIQTYFNRGFATILGSALTLVGTFVVMFRMSPRLAFFSLAVVPFLMMAIARFAGRIRRETAALQAQESDVLARANEGLSSIRVVHAFGRESHEVDLFRREARESLEANLRLSMTNVASTLVVGTLLAAGTAALLWAGAGEVAAGKMTLGDLLVFLAYLGMLYSPLEQLSYTAWSMEGAAGAAQRVFEVLDTPDEVPDPAKPEKLPAGAGAIEFRGVGFRYARGDEVLHELSFTVAPGESVAVVGGTGAGKTTLLSLLPRFYDPTGGSILFHGTDLRRLAKKDLRSHQALVLQETVLLNGTVRENIAYGRPGASFREIQKAAEDAQADEFIRQLPQGYDTSVGERGVMLSGGQRQRIGIARAFLRDAPILLLDEPTSALDAATEKELLGVLGKLMSRPTTLLVTHRLHAAHRADRILVLEKGRLVEEGKGEELLARHGAYWRLWQSANG